MQLSYEEKLNECSRRVYGCNYSQKPRQLLGLEITIDRDVEKPIFNMNEDVDNIILAAVNYFWLPPYMADRAKFIIYNMWSYPDNFHDIKYENVVLGILMNVVYKDYFCEDATVDFNSYCADLFGTAKVEKNVNQMYKAYEIVHDLCKNVGRDYHE